MATTLTQRYVAAIIKSLHPDTVADVRDELLASIADAVEARTGQGEKPADAERAVLAELGDSGILAAGYADRPLHLIGPRYYLTWLKLLKILLVVVPVTAIAGVVLAQMLVGASFGTIVGQVFAVGVQVVVQVAFWLTVVFVVLERSGADTGVHWDVDQLPEIKEDGAGKSTVVGGLIYLGVLAGALLWDSLVGFLRLDGAAVPVLNPGVWPWAGCGLLLLIAAEAAHAILVFRLGRWTFGLATVKTVLALAFLVLALALLIRGQLFGAEFIQHVFTDNGVNADTMRTLGICTAFAIAGIAAWDIADAWLRALRAGRLSRQ